MRQERSHRDSVDENGNKEDNSNTDNNKDDNSSDSNSDTAENGNSDNKDDNSNGNNGSNNEIPHHSPSYYQYELVGVVVHMGTADSGHYYSYIKERVPLEGSERRVCMRTC